jgi:hypothetical protein
MSGADLHQPLKSPIGGAARLAPIKTGLPQCTDRRGYSREIALGPRTHPAALRRTIRSASSISSSRGSAAMITFDASAGLNLRSNVPEGLRNTMSDQSWSAHDLTSGRRRPRPGEKSGLVYSRFNNPNLGILEDRVAPEPSHPAAAPVALLSPCVQFLRRPFPSSLCRPCGIRCWLRPTSFSMCCRVCSPLRPRCRSAARHGLHQE